MENENKFIPKYIRQKISDNEMILTFTSSGNTYKFTAIDIQKAQLQAFKDVNAMNIKEIADIIKNKLIQIENEKQKDSDIIKYIPHLKILVADITNKINKDFDEITSDYSNIVFNDFINNWKNSPIGEQDDYYESAEKIFEQNLLDTVYSQDMKKLDITDTDNIIMVKCNEAGPQYFYTNNEIINGYQIWYKALNPFIWYGIKQ